VKIYTKTGDTGETSLLGGQRVAKDHLRVVAYGDLDETNAAIGAARSAATPAVAQLLFEIQKDLFAMGAQLADPAHDVAARRVKAAVTAAQVERLERAIDDREAVLPELRAFVLPGGSPAATSLHLARTVCRRAERSAVALAHHADIDPQILVYLNRLSDLLFVLARAENHAAGVAEVPW
jgi:cob(I)alamin adenosyltransferase